MTQREIDRTASILRPGAREVPHAPEPDYREPFGFERHELMAAAACVAIGGLFAVAVQFLPMLAKWIVE